MKAICKKTTSEGFDLKKVTTVFSNSFDYSFGGSGLELGKEYTIMGVALYKDSTCLYFLIDTFGRPNWFPHLLFDVLENSIPLNWHMKLNGNNKDGDIYCLWGFDELCNDETYYDRLIERDEAAMSIFFRRKPTFLSIGGENKENA